MAGGAAADLRRLLAAVSDACAAVDQASASGAADSRRDIVEAECLHAAGELEDAVAGRRLVSTCVADAKAGEAAWAWQELRDIVKLLLAAPDRLHNARLSARRAGGTAEPEPLLPVPSAHDAHARLAERHTRRTSSLEALPPSLAAPEKWATLVCDGVVSNVCSGGQNKEADAAAADLLHQLRLRGFTGSAAAPLLRCRGVVADRAAAVLAGLRGATSGAILAQLLRDIRPDGDGAALVRRWALATGADAAEAASLTAGAYSCLSRDQLRLPVVRILVDALIGPRGETLAGDAAAVGKAVRRRVLAGFADAGSLGKQPTSLCHAAVLFIERTPRDELEGSGGLLGCALDGVSARLSSPLPAHRRMSAVAARAISDVVSPEQPLDFPEFPGAYDEWSDECARRTAPATLAREAAAAPRKRPRPPRQEDPDELAFGGPEQEEPSSPSSAGSWWGSEAGDDPSLPFAAASPAREQSLMTLQDSLKVLQGKKEDTEELDRVFSGLEKRLRTERAEEVAALANALARCLLTLGDSYGIANFHELRTGALRALAVRAPRDAVPVLVGMVWGENLSTLQRMDVLRVLCEAASELRRTPVETESDEREEGQAPLSEAAAEVGGGILSRG
eukprot:TRINITY_DN10039_c0_g1_i1.p1 TRINITY_DN10039_c0_g1~~TRINITY_DN10039_c0_g1_i1.p1  ORF type:complete len:634 (+),score=191.35 TRINITY_DN10039_c0_g1_i1:40-1902(+)